MPARIDIPAPELAALCRRWHVEEMSLFGSALRDDFRPDSGIDVLVRFASDFRKTLFDLARMREELAALLGRPVDLVQESGLVNPFRCKAILSSREVVYAA